MSASVRSMTGYGRGEHIAEERKFTVEMKSVNHRYNDMTIKLPRSLAGLEDKIKKRIMHEVFRGKTDVYISFETFSAADVEVKLNEALAAAYIEKLKLIEEKFGIYSENKLELAAKFPDVITVEKAQQEEEVIWEALVPALDEAVEKFVAMRTGDGHGAGGRILSRYAWPHRPTGGDGRLLRAGRHAVRPGLSFSRYAFPCSRISFSTGPAPWWMTWP